MAFTCGFLPRDLDTILPDRIIFGDILDSISWDSIPRAKSSENRIPLLFMSPYWFGGPCLVYKDNENPLDRPQACLNFVSGGYGGTFAMNPDEPT